MFMNFVDYCLRRPLRVRKLEVEGVVGDVVGLLQVFVVHLRDVGRILQDVVGIPPDVMEFAENIITSPRSLKSDEMGTHPAGRYGICRKHIHDSKVFEE
jgi:hypothetical protein